MRAPFARRADSLSAPVRMSPLCLGTSMQRRVRQAGVAAKRIKLAVAELVFPDSVYTAAVRVLAGYEAYAAVPIDWSSSMWVHSRGGQWGGAGR